MSDFSAPDCLPGSHGCVPHWYCYIPGMATPDCLASFVTGTGELAAAAGATAGQLVGSAATGAVGGVFSGLFAPSSTCDASDWWCQYGVWALVIGGAAAFLIVTGGRRRR